MSQEKKDTNVTGNNKGNNSWLITSIIIFCVVIPVIVEIIFPQYTVRPLIMLLLIGIGMASLIYYYLGGLGDSKMKTPVFTIGGSAAFCIIFAYFFNPILEKQTMPRKGQLFQPSSMNWIPVDKQSLVPLDSLSLNFMDYHYSGKDFGKYDNNKNLFFDFENSGGEGNINIYPDAGKKSKLGKIEADKIINSLSSNSSVSVKNHLVFLDKLYVEKGSEFEVMKLNEKNKYKRQSNSLAWFPYHIKPSNFGNDASEYQIIKKNTGEELAIGTIQGRGSNVHVIDNRIFLIMVHGVNHTANTKWANFGVFELGTTNKISLN